MNVGVKERFDGKRSAMYISDKCLITVNPDTGILIQTNLNKKKKVK